jgi:hypothetical protein
MQKDLTANRIALHGRALHGHALRRRALHVHTVEVRTGLGGRSGSKAESSSKGGRIYESKPFMIVSSEVVLHLMGGTVAERA